MNLYNPPCGLGRADEDAGNHLLVVGWLYRRKEDVHHVMLAVIPGFHHNKSTLQGAIAALGLSFCLGETPYDYPVACRKKCVNV